MDPLTHAVSGAVLARALPARPLPARKLALLMLLAMAPDADIALEAVSDVAYLQYHRGVTHSLLMLPLWVWLLHAMIRRRAGGVPHWLIAAAIALHILLDLITSFGTMILAPVSDWRATLDLVFIIDPLLTAGILLPLLLTLAVRAAPRRRALAALGLLWIAGWLSLCASEHRQALELARKAHPDALAVAALPLPFSPAHWQLIATYRGHFARANVDLLPALAGSEPLFSASFVRRFLPPLDPPARIRWHRLPRLDAVPEAAHVPGVAFYRWFARFPALLQQTPERMVFGDLRFGAGNAGVDAPFGLVVETGAAPRAWLIWRAGKRTLLR